MKNFVLTRRAAHDLDEIWNYLARDNIEAADSMLDELESAIYGLSRRPGLGHFREELSDRKHKFFAVSTYLIVYRHQTKPLQVIRVLHARSRYPENP